MEEIKNNWDWNKALPMDVWHGIALDKFPEWEKPNGEIPTSVFLSVEKGKDKSSRDLAIETDDWCKGNFYYRDWTQSGLPFVDEGEIYNSRFWFQFQVDAEEFAKRYGGKLEGLAALSAIEQTK